MGFEPIAIVGRGAVLPDALDPDTLWTNIAAGRTSLSTVTDGRWGVPVESVLTTSDDPADASWSDVGGYVRGFDTVFDPCGYAIEADQVLALDPQFRWVLHGARAALREAGEQGPVSRAGLILGNLSFPSAGMAEYAQGVWRAGRRSDPRNRFCSGLPAQLAAVALELGLGGFALDAACASSLYAIKLACDRLHDRSADLMVAGAVNCCDDLFIHIGFSALSALSRTGRSRPFHRDADGLVPAEGAAFVALMRLSDAMAADRPVLGVIRGIGLTNDGRGTGLLVPSAEGQERAMRLAYAAAGIAPESVSLVECHATGTPVGDIVEVGSLARVFAGHSGLPIGSAKSNLGHLITAAGIAGLLKVLGAMRAGLRPPTLHADDPIEALAGTPLRLVRELEEWPGLRRAGVSAFGFGGNNAHLVVDAPDVAVAAVEPPPTRPATSVAPAPVAIVVIGSRVAAGADAADLTRALLTGDRVSRAMDSIDVELDGLRFPPLDLKQAAAQQVLMLETAREAVRGFSFPRERTMVLVGMGCDAEVARYGARWRARPGDRDAVSPVLRSAGVVGTMPNVCANRLNLQLDLAGPSFTVSAEEASGLVALDLAVRALRAGEVDVAIVGAVDLSREVVHQAALADLGIKRESGDAAVVVVLTRLADAERDGHEVIALVDEPTEAAADLRVGDEGFDPGALFGTAHAAKGLLAVVTAALALRHRATPRTGAPADPAFDAATADVVVRPLAGPPARTRLRAGRSAPWVADAPPAPHVFSGADQAGVLTALATGRESPEGPARLVILAADAADLAARVEDAKRWLVCGGPQPDGVAFRARPIAGQMGFVFTGGLAAYPGMGRELLLAFPGLIEDIAARSGSTRRAAGWAFAGADSRPAEVLDQIWGTALLSQVHAAISRDVLGLTPHAALGYSAGESNALVALGAWTDMRELVAEMTESGMFSREVAGEFAAILRCWRRQGIPGTQWRNYLVGAGADQAREALRGEAAAHLIAINAPDSCIVGGEVSACERALSRLDAAYTLPVPYELAVHTPELTEVRDDWWRLHHRPTSPPPGVRFYSCATDSAYLPTARRVADALTSQAVSTMDFAGTVERAWADGVRVFVEHGPKALCTDWIRRTLGERDHLAIALDAVDGRSVWQLSRVAAELIAAGIPVNAEALRDHLASARPATAEPRRSITLAAHPPQVRFDDTESTPVPASRPTAKPAAAPGTVMPRAPQLPPVLSTPEHVAPEPPGADEPVLAPTPDDAPANVGPPGPKFDRAALERLASGRISDLFGPLFAAQDGYRRQTRMPEPPMLLADRVTGIDGEPASMGTGTIWTETDVRPGAWYLDSTGRMPPGMLIEAGQADLLLISRLGADLLNRGERVYRLLGCDLTLHGSPPVPGETLRYEIHIDDHAELNGVRLFFFHYDCYAGDELRLSVRAGQAGFFTDAELTNTSGVIWDPTSVQPGTGRVDPPLVAGAPRQFSAEAVRAFAGGRPYDCFGTAWDITRSHVRSPRIDDGRLLLLGAVTEFDPSGGPWRRGYLNARTTVAPDDWFFAGHFKNDPCMPGTLMFQGCLQAMSFYLAACGVTISNDGWRFEPVTGELCAMRCRGQVTPDSRHLSYEVFVSELATGPIPTLYADVLCTVDGVKAFHAKRVGLRLVPDWPLEQWRALCPAAHQETGAAVPLRALGGLAGYRDGRLIAEADGLRFDYESLLTCAWGRPSDAFGRLYSRFDTHRRVARLPGPPYHFMTRITAVEGRLGGMEIGSVVVAEYDVPDRAWYWEQNAQPTMPLSVLTEVALQPCGWLASYAGCAVAIDNDLLFRNLDGTGRITGEVTAATSVIRTRARLCDISINQTMIIVSFEVECAADGTAVFNVDTVFGFFPVEAFVDPPGLPTPKDQRAAMTAPTAALVDLTTRPARYCAGSLRLPGPMLLMLDRITGYDPNGGAAGLGRLSAAKDVDSGEWFFKAHFFQDPVQPGSLGLEALYQLLQFYLLERGAGAGTTAPHFEMLTDGRPLVWKYRGQVLPTHHVISSELEVTEFGNDARGPYALAKAWLWVDGKRIYSAIDIGVRVASGDSAEETLDVAVDSWLADHRPTWTVPVLPMMSVLDRLAAAAGVGSAFVLRDVKLRRWIPVARPARLRTELANDPDAMVSLLVWREARTAALSRFEPVATAMVGVPGPRPAPLPSLAGADPVTDHYGSGELFHGPAFHYLVALRRGVSGASGVLDAGRGAVPRGRLHQGLLDAATHVIPHQSLWQWSDEIPRGVVAYPHRITVFEQFEALPDEGPLTVEARFAGFDADDRRLPMIDVQLVMGGSVLVAFRLVEVLMPTGPFGAAGPARRRAFLRDRAYAGGLGLSTTDGETTTLTLTEVAQCDWLAGTVGESYGLPPGARGRDHLACLAVQDHVARLARVHPSEVRVNADLHSAQVAGMSYRIHVEERADTVAVRSRPSPEKARPTASFATVASCSQGGNHL